MDALTKIHAEEAKLAAQLAPRLRKRLQPDLDRQFAALAAAAKVDLDREATDLSVERELYRDVLRALSGYSEWLAAAVWRSTRAMRPSKLPLPALRDDELAAIAERYDLAHPEVLQEVLSVLRLEPAVLPVVGRIDAGVVEPDYSALAAWAEHYDWDT